jgi:hypothetical protein
MALLEALASVVLFKFSAVIPALNSVTKVPAHQVKKASARAEKVDGADLLGGVGGVDIAMIFSPYNSCCIKLSIFLL